MNTASQIKAFLKRAEKWALANPGQSFRRTVIFDNGALSMVTRAMYEETCIESEYRGEIFAIKEPRKVVYSNFEAASRRTY